MSEITIENTVTWELPKYPGHSNFEDGLWIEFIVLKVESQNTIARSKDAISVRPTGESFKFLSPRDIQVSVTHDWDTYDSIASRAAGVAHEADVQYGDIKGVMYNLWYKGWKKSSLGSNVVLGRVDAPLIYKDSPRLSYIFNFELAYWSDNKKEISEPVNKLLYLSSPETKDAFIHFESPNIFRIRSLPDDSFLHIDYAALVAVQPSYSGPFRKGHPSKCELTLQFTDLQPVNKATFKRDNRVVSSEK